VISLSHVPDSVLGIRDGTTSCFHRVSNLMTEINSMHLSSVNA
jgi:hypothetical protein